MRMALVEIVGMLIHEIAVSDEGEQESREKKINNLFELLTERFLDLSSYVRAKVINTLSRICELRMSSGAYTRTDAAHTSQSSC